MSAHPHVAEPIASRTPAPHVLIVDDAALMRDMFGRYLGFAGMVVRYAADGLEGIAAVRAEPPDLILCDLDMPEMSGIELCRRLHADPATADVPILIMSGGDPAGLQAAVEAGCDGVLVKPCSQTLLVASIRQILARRSETR
jgi:CheY-like chemotaxis protein